MKFSFTILKSTFAGKFYLEFMSTKKINLHIYRREKGLDTSNDGCTIFKLDAKLVLLYDGTEYPISSVDFAPYAGPKKIGPMEAKCD